MLTHDTELMLATYKDQALRIKAEADALTISDDATAELATSMLLAVDRAGKQADAYRGSLVKPLNDSVKEINAAVRDTMDPITGADLVLRRKIRDWKTAEHERLRREREAYQATQDRLAREAAEARAAATRTAQAAQDARAAAEAATTLPDFLAAEEQATTAAGEAETARQAAAATVAEARQAPPPPPPPARSIQVGTGSAGLRKRWTFEIVNPALVPCDYHVVDAERIRRAVAAGVRSIAGVRIFETEDVVVRR